MTMMVHTLIQKASRLLSRGRPDLNGEFREKPAETEDFENLDAAPKVVRITNATALLDPAIYDLVRRMLISNPATNVRQAFFELMYLLPVPDFGIFCVQEGEDWVGSALMQVSRGLTDGAFVLHFYHDGSPTARRRLVDEMEAFARSRQAKRVFAIDGEATFMRLFMQGRQTRAHGQLVEIDLSEG
jgi:hypothetical protein